MRNILCVIAIMALALTGAMAGQTQPTVTTSCIEASTGHKINGYKYLCMANQGNLHDLEDKFNAYFRSIGFEIVTPEEEEEFDEEKRKYVLYGTYEVRTVDDDFYSLTLTLRNREGKIVFSTTKQSGIFFSLRKSINRGSDKIIKQLKELNYKFDETAR